MEIPVINYYNQDKFSNTFYLIMIAIETYFSKNLFKDDLTRVFYASEAYAFRQRLNLLAAQGADSINELQLPFMSYFREGNWKNDTRAAVQNATAALAGFPESVISYQLLRFLQVMATFSCICFANSDADAQLMYEILLWIQQPAPKQFTFGSMDYLGGTFDIPITFAIENLEFNPSTNEKDWLVKNRVFLIKFDLVVKSVVIAQQPQTPDSTLFEDQTPPVITKTVILDYLAYKNQSTWTDLQHIDFEVMGTFNNDPQLNGSLTVTGITNTSITVSWTENPASVPNYQPNVILILNNYPDSEVTVPLSAGTYTFTDLEPQSTYQIGIWFTSNLEQVTKYTATATTGTNMFIGLKGMVGAPLH
jgi:Fibronectin type III domain